MKMGKKSRKKGDVAETISLSTFLSSSEEDRYN
jgi:hypothetical protein